MKILSYIKASIVLLGVIVNCGFGEDVLRKDLVPIVSLNGYNFKLSTKDMRLENEENHDLVQVFNMKRFNIFTHNCTEILFDLSFPNFEGSAYIDYLDCSYIKIIDGGGVEWPMFNSPIWNDNTKIDKDRKLQTLGVVKGIPHQGYLVINGRLLGMVSVYESDGEKFLISDILKEGIEIDGSHCEVVTRESRGKKFIDIKLPTGAEYDIRIVQPSSETESSEKQNSYGQYMKKGVFTIKYDNEVPIENMSLLFSKKIAEFPFDVPFNDCINFKIKLNP